MKPRTATPILLCMQKLANAVLGLTLLTPIVSSAQPVPPINIWQTESCNCCKQWSNEMQNHGFLLNVHTVPDTTAYRRQLGIPDELASCQTAQAGPYALEGPVPVLDIIDLLQAQPDIIGLINPNREGPNPKEKTNSSTAKRTYILHKNGQATPLHPN
ncbi:MAG: DUF411 domain-containing protein [Advenella sp.]|nr:DUF411 domain-containing protein [Advenella sp.]